MSLGGGVTHACLTPRSVTCRPGSGAGHQMPWRSSTASHVGPALHSGLAGRILGTKQAAGTARPEYRGGGGVTTVR